MNTSVLAHFSRVLGAVWPCLANGSEGLHFWAMQFSLSEQTTAIAENTQSSVMETTTMESWFKPQRQACHLRKHSRRFWSACVLYLCQGYLPTICSHSASKAGEEHYCFSFKTTSLEGNTHPFSMYAFSLWTLPTHLSFTLIIKKKKILKKEKKKKRSLFPLGCSQVWSTHLSCC